MRVTLAVHGGLAAGITRAPHVVDTADLPPAEAAELTRLASAALAAIRPRSTRRSPDAMSYTITIDGEKLSGSDTDATTEFAGLLAFLTR